MALSTQVLPVPQQLDALEQQLGKLLGMMENLAIENQSLRERESKLRIECDELHKKNAAASLQIEAVIERLKNPAENKEA